MRDKGQWRERHEDQYGRGLDMMRQFMDEVTIDRSPLGTKVSLTRTLSRSEVVA